MEGTGLPFDYLLKWLVTVFIPDSELKLSELNVLQL